MRKERNVTQIPDLREVPGLTVNEHYVRHGRLVKIDNSISLGYITRQDKRVQRTKIKNTRIVLVTPLEMSLEDLTHDNEIPEPYEVNDTHKAIGIYINSERKVLRASDYILDLQRKTESYGAKNLELKVASWYPELDSRMIKESVPDAHKLEAHLRVLYSREQVIFEA